MVCVRGLQVFAQQAREVLRRRALAEASISPSAPAGSGRSATTARASRRCPVKRWSPTYRRCRSRRGSARRASRCRPRTRSPLEGGASRNMPSSMAISLRGGGGGRSRLARERRPRRGPLRHAVGRKGRTPQPSIRVHPVGVGDERELLAGRALVEERLREGGVDGDLSGDCMVLLHGRWT